MAGYLRVRLYFLRLLALVHLIAFLSLLSQVRWLIGQEGLLPAERLLSAVHGRVAWWQLPTLFAFAHSDRVLVLAAVAGAVLSLALCFGVLPRLVLLGLWGLYLSFVSVGQVFFAFQWDNLLLEATFFSVWVAPWRGRDLCLRPPHPAAVFLLRWLLLRLHVESGLAKVLSGDPSWRDLTAMATYYETAPLPTWLAWYAHQLPLWAQRASTAAVLVIEILFPWALFSNRVVRLPAVATLAALQIAIVSTANYGFFNYLTLALCLWGLDDRDLQLLWPQAKSLQLPGYGRATVWFGWGVALLVAAFTLLPFAKFLPGQRGSMGWLYEYVEPWRTVNAYHLFASMTYVRREAVLEVSEDGEQWRELHFRYKPGDPAKRPAFVAPHQPRVDFQLWFLLLRGEPRAPYFFALLEVVLSRPRVVAPLFTDLPSDVPPRLVRVVLYRYRFTDWRTAWRSGHWWTRERLGESRPMSRFGGALS